MGGKSHELQYQTQRQWGNAQADDQTPEAQAGEYIPHEEAEEVMARAKRTKAGEQKKTVSPVLDVHTTLIESVSIAYLETMGLYHEGDIVGDLIPRYDLEDLLKHVPEEPGDAAPHIPKKRR